MAAAPTRPNRRVRRPLLPRPSPLPRRRRRLPPRRRLRRETTYAADDRPEPDVAGRSGRRVHHRRRPDRTRWAADPCRPGRGAVLGTEPVDFERSRQAQEALPGGVRSTVDLGDVAYAFDQVVYDSGTLDTDFYPDVDLCGQNVVTVRSEAASALPARAHVLSVSPDDRYVVTLSSVCPEAGTMGADAVGTQLPFTATFQVFDARQPEPPDRHCSRGWRP